MLPKTNIRVSLDFDRELAYLNGKGNTNIREVVKVLAIARVKVFDLQGIIGDDKTFFSKENINN